MELLDSRRVTGPNLLLQGPGVVAEVALGEDEAKRFLAAWPLLVADMLSRLDWPRVEAQCRRYAGGASVGFSGPIDRLYAGTEVNEWAIAAAAASEAPSPEARETAAKRLATLIAEEQRPALLALQAAAAARDVDFLWCDDFATVGLGTGSTTWPVEELPSPAEVDWDQAHGIPVLLVTGTNGKSTTVRLLAHMVSGAGLVPGQSSTDWIRVGDETLDTGDYSGPGGARAVLRDTRTEVAILETARGGMLRRGLAVRDADAAAVLNVAEDHLGEWGIDTVEGLVEVKFLVEQAVLGPRGELVLNADEPKVLARGQRSESTPVWFGLDLQSEALHAAQAAGEDVYGVQDGMLVRVRKGVHEPLAAEADIPLTVGGRARFNTLNALAAAALATRVGLSRDAIQQGLETFESSPDANPGRGNVFEIDGATVFADFAHNPHGTKALLELARAYEPKRVAILLGQAGDRSDAEVRALVEATWAGQPDLIVIKAMDRHLRGRAPGEMTTLIQRELERLGAPADRIEHAPSELEAAQRALAWAQPGDLVLMLLHAQRDEVLALLTQASTPA